MIRHYAPVSVPQGLLEFEENLKFIRFLVKTGQLTEWPEKEHIIKIIVVDQDGNFASPDSVRKG